MNVGAWREGFRARLAEPVDVDRPLTEADIWDRHGPLLWRAPSFAGTPHFYPVYRHGDLYSHSPLALVLAKGRFEPEPRAVAEEGKPAFNYVPATIPPDRGIVRLGGPHPVSGGIDRVDVLVERLTEAMKADVAAAEARHPGCTNLVLCGGKDSLNLLLLPWTNPVVAVSARPNYELVRRFVAENGLGMEVVELTDPYDPGLRTIETALGLGRANLEHWRWGGALVELAEHHGRKAIFWKGQVADAYTTPKWRRLAHRPGRVEHYARALWSRLGPRAGVLDDLVGGLMLRRFADVTWVRCAALQGCHMDFIRELTGVLPLSAYHGPAVSRVLEQAVLPPLTRRDVRFDIGERLLGRPVRYPNENPAPGPSIQRAGASAPAAVARAVAEMIG